MPMTFGDAAYALLSEAGGGPLHATAMVKTALERGMIISHGKTPHLSMATVLLTDSKQRFRNLGRNQWVLTQSSEQRAQVTQAQEEDQFVPQVLGQSLRAYVELVSHLNGSSYTAAQIVELLGRITPQIVTLVSPPDADELVEDLLLLRLLEPLQDGTYRRWAHLSDATVTHMVRYAALTMLIATSDDSYRLPVLLAPFDGLPHATNEWPLNEERLRWYEEAGLVHHNEDGTWQAE